MRFELYVKTKYGMAVARQTQQWADKRNGFFVVSVVAEIRGQGSIEVEYKLSERDVQGTACLAMDEERRHLIRQAIEAALDHKPAPPDEPSPACPFAVGDRVYHITQQGVFKMAVVKPGPEQTLCEWFDVSRSPVLRKFDNRNIVKDGSGV